MLHLQEDWYLKRATKENLKIKSQGAQCAECASHPEKERDGNQLALKSNRPPEWGPLGPRSQRKNVYQLNQINTSGPL